MKPKKRMDWNKTRRIDPNLRADNPFETARPNLYVRAFMHVDDRDRQTLVNLKIHVLQSDHPLVTVVSTVTEYDEIKAFLKDTRARVLPLEKAAKLPEMKGLLLAVMPRPGLAQQQIRAFLSRLMPWSYIQEVRS